MTPEYPVILNPTAGGGRLLRQRGKLDAAAQRAGVRLAWWFTREPGHAAVLAHRAADDEIPMVFAFGGDGTYNEVGRGLLGSRTVLAPLPGGTTSVLAYEFGIVRPAWRALLQLLEGEDRDMRVGRTDNGEIFLLMLSAGPDTVVLDHLGPKLKRLGGRVGVAVQAAIELVANRGMPRLRVRVNGDSLNAGWAIVGNSRCYAGPFQATPGADPFANHLEVVLQRSLGRRAALAFALGLARRRHLQRGDVAARQAEEITIEAEDNGGATKYQIDGDLAGELPVRMSVAPEVLRIRVPRGA